MAGARITNIFNRSSISAGHITKGEYDYAAAGAVKINLVKTSEPKVPDVMLAIEYTAPHVFKTKIPDDTASGYYEIHVYDGTSETQYINSVYILAQGDGNIRQPQDQTRSMPHTHATPAIPVLFSPKETYPNTHPNTDKIVIFTSIISDPNTFEVFDQITGTGHLIKGKDNHSFEFRFPHSLFRHQNEAVLHDLQIHFQDGSSYLLTFVKFVLSI